MVIFNRIGAVCGCGTSLVHEPGVNHAQGQAQTATTLCPDELVSGLPTLLSRKANHTGRRSLHKVHVATGDDKEHPSNTPRSDASTVAEAAGSRSTTAMSSSSAVPEVEHPPDNPDVCGSWAASSSEDSEIHSRTHEHTATAILTRLHLRSHSGDGPENVNMPHVTRQGSYHRSFSPVSSTWSRFERGVTEESTEVDGVWSQRRRRLQHKLRALTRMAHYGSEHHDHIRVVRTKSFQAELEQIQALTVPVGPPIVVHKLPGTIEDVHDVLVQDEASPLVTFLERSMGCEDVAPTPWMEDLSESMTTMRCKYRVPVPKDVPEILRKALNLPNTISSVTLNAVGYRLNALVMVQHSRSDGVLYSDRMRVQTTHTFRADPSGGVEWKQWSELVWLNPLPWTHSFLMKIMQQKAIEEVKARAPAFELCLLEALETRLRHRSS